MMSEKTIYDAFFSSLPSLPLSDSAIYRQVTTAATSTLAEEPLRAFRWILLTRGRKYLSEIRGDDILRKCATSPLPNTIKTEADVTAQAILYLLHHENHLINRGLKNGRIECHLEWTQKGKMRTDYRWTFYPLNGEPLNFAVLEIKAPNLVSWNDFEEAVAKNDSEEIKKSEIAINESTGTLLESNAKIFVQQVKKYLKELRINDAALFDWKHLVIIDTEGLDEDTRNIHLARLAWFEEEGKDVANGVNFHMMILGFLLRAMDRYPQIC